MRESPFKDAPELAGILKRIRERGRADRRNRARAWIKETVRLWLKWAPRAAVLSVAALGAFYMSYEVPWAFAITATSIYWSLGFFHQPRFPGRIANPRWARLLVPVYFAGVGALMAWIDHTGPVVRAALSLAGLTSLGMAAWEVRLIYEMLEQTQPFRDLEQKVAEVKRELARRSGA